MRDLRAVLGRGLPADVEQAAQAALKAGRGRPNVRAAIERVQAAATEPVDAALARERELFQQYRMSDDAAALRHLFFAEREAGKAPDDLVGEARPLRRTAVLGGGTMGAGIAICLAEAGLEVAVIERTASRGAGVPGAPALTTGPGGSAPAAATTSRRRHSRRASRSAPTGRRSPTSTSRSRRYSRTWGPRSRCSGSSTP